MTNDVQVMSIFDIPFNTDYKNKLLSVISVAPPLIKGHAIKHRSGVNPGNQANAEFIEDYQGGLLASVKTVTGIVTVKFECTPEYWKEFKKSNLWRYHDDIILLKFDEAGKVMGHVLQENEMLDIINDGAERQNGRLLYVDSKGYNHSEKNGPEFAGPTLIIERDKNDNFSPKYISKDYDNNTVNIITEGLKSALAENNGSIEKMDIVADNYIVSDVRGNDRYYYILPLE